MNEDSDSEYEELPAAPAAVEKGKKADDGSGDSDSSDDDSSSDGGSSDRY